MKPDAFVWRCPAHGLLGEWSVGAGGRCFIKSGQGRKWCARDCERIPVYFEDKARPLVSLLREAWEFPEFPAGEGMVSTAEETDEQRRWLEDWSRLDDRVRIALTTFNQEPILNDAANFASGRMKGPPPGQPKQDGGGPCHRESFDTTERTSSRIVPPPPTKGEAE